MPSAVAPLFVDQFIGILPDRNLQLGGGLHTINLHPAHEKQDNLLHLFSPMEDGIWESEWLIRYKEARVHEWIVNLFGETEECRQLTISQNGKEDTKATYQGKEYTVQLESLDRMTMRLIFSGEDETLICTEGIVPKNDHEVDILIVYKDRHGSSELYGRLHAILIPSP